MSAMTVSHLRGLANQLRAFDGVAAHPDGCFCQECRDLMRIASHLAEPPRAACPAPVPTRTAAPVDASLTAREQRAASAVPPPIDLNARLRAGRPAAPRVLTPVAPPDDRGRPRTSVSSDVPPPPDLNARLRARRGAR